MNYRLPDFLNAISSYIYLIIQLPFTIIIGFRAFIGFFNWYTVNFGRQFIRNYTMSSSFQEEVSSSSSKNIDCVQVLLVLTAFLKDASLLNGVNHCRKHMLIKKCLSVSYTHLDVYKRQDKVLCCI